MPLGIILLHLCFLLLFQLFAMDSHDHFHRWRRDGINQVMVECLGHSLSNDSKSRIRGNLLEIKNNGTTISLRPFDDNSFQYINNTVALHRLNALKNGIIQAIEYAKLHLQISNFPFIYALVNPSDEDSFLKSNTSCCRLENNETEMNSSFPWAPLLAQNRRMDMDNIVVLIPDFSYFTDFNYIGDHGGASDVWFTAVDREQEVYAQNEQQNYTPMVPSPFHPSSFLSKVSEGVWRGKTVRRAWAGVRRAVMKCNAHGVVNSSGPFITKTEMCRRYQAIITLPGNGVWSWATKHNLVSHTNLF